MKQENLRKIIELRHALHRNPDLSLKEAGTLALIKEFISSNTSLEIHERGGWMYAVKHAYNDEGSIAFRADMDALHIDESIVIPYASEKPGISHKCGHDGHCAALCGLALEIDRLELKRSVYLVFQHAEEIGAGGLVCSDIIAEKGIREIYAFHNLSGYPAGSIVIKRGLAQPASVGLEIIFKGREAHASAPKEGLNPAEAIAKFVLDMSKRYENDSQNVMCTVTGVRVGAGDFGISPGDGTVRITLRSESEDAMKKADEDIREMANKRGMQCGLSLKFEHYEYFPETVNSNECVARTIDAAGRLDLSVVELESPWLASEDFGYYLKKCPGAIFYIGSGETWPALHTGAYDFNDDVLPVAVNMFAELI